MGRRTVKRELTSTQPNDHEQNANLAINGEDAVAGHIMGNHHHGFTAGLHTPTQGTAQIINDDGSLHTMGRGIKELVQTVQALRHLGVEQLDLPLPKVVIVGDQSTGKSSLIEGISEIKVPRAADCCTRSPLEINLTEAKTWKCTVSLCKKYAYLGVPESSRKGKAFAKSEGATRGRPLGPWQHQDIEDFHFATITNKDEAPRVLYWAQLATLNPGNDYKTFIPGSEPTPSHQFEVKFSPNLIRLDIAGPGLPNLAFYDLPGVINVSEVREEAYLVDLVRNLVKTYVQTNESIILLALPINADPANSSASRLVRECKAEIRTLGCLTKPDRLQEGESIDQWIHILKGEKYRLGLGYFVIKNNPDPSVDHVVARQEEKVFFSEVEPWATTLQCYSETFGTQALQTKLSQLLTQKIQTSLPLIRAKVQEKDLNIAAELQELPQPISGNISAEIMGKLMKFDRLLQQHLDGGSKDFPFPRLWNEAAVVFRKTLADTRPLLQFPRIQQDAAPNTPSRSSVNTPNVTPSSSISRNTVAISLDSDDEANSLPYFLKRRHSPDGFTPTKMQKNQTSMAQKLSMSVQPKRFTVQEVKSIMQTAYTGIPDREHPIAIEQMVLASIGHWETPLDHFLGETERLVKEMVFDRVEEAFGSHAGTAFYDLIQQICEGFFEQAVGEQRTIAMRILEWETAKPMTLNEEALRRARDAALNNLLSARRQSRATQYVNAQEAKSGKYTSGQTRAEKVAKVSDSQLEPEVWTSEINAISTVKAYYECAYSRFTDVICLSIFHTLFGKSNERLAVLLAANQQDEIRRLQLTKEKHALEKAQQRLEELA